MLELVENLFYICERFLQIEEWIELKKFYIYIYFF